MSKRFKSQDYFRYKRLGKRWRRPVGWQSKLRLKKGGSGMSVSVGYRTPAVTRYKVRGVDYRIVSNLKDLDGVGKAESILIASGVGAKKTKEIAEKAKHHDIRILNMKKVKRSKRLAREIEKKHKEKVKVEKKTEEKKTEEKAKKTKAEAEEVKAEVKAETKHETKHEPKEAKEAKHEPKED